MVVKKSPVRKLRTAKKMPMQKTPAKPAAPIAHSIEDAELMAAIDRAVEISRKLAALSEEDKDVRGTIVTGITERGEKTVKGTSGRATLSAKRTTEYNEPSLQKRLGASLWNKITTRVLDKKKLLAYIASGEVDGAVVAACSSETTGKPYVTIYKD